MGNDDYRTSRGINEDDGFLEDTQGNRLIGKGVKADLDGLQGYSKNLDTLQTNYRALATRFTGPLQGMVVDTFFNAGNIFEWSRYMSNLMSFNIRKFDQFNMAIATGTANIASAAQVVANVYRDTDAGSAADLNAIEFAFGNKDKAPDSLPKEFVKKLEDYNTVYARAAAENPVAAAAASGQPMPSGQMSIVSPDGNTVTTTLPGGNQMITITQPWSTYPGGPSGETKIVKYNGQVVSTTTTTTVSGTTTTRVTQSSYDAQGNRTDRVSSETRKTYSVEGTGPDTTLKTTTETTTYDAKGNPTTTSNSVGVPYDAADEPLPDPNDDPAERKKRELLGLPEPG